MTVLLVLFTFAAFLLIDHYRTRHALVQPAVQVAAAKQDAAPRLNPALVGGFEVPENLRYHPGHTWALSESPSLVRVGMDDFASKLVGKVESIALPLRGQWIRQGQKMCTLHRDGCAVDMVSPIEGTVSDINQAITKDPKLALRDPYGEGWLVTVQAPDAKTSFRNLLGGALAALVDGRVRKPPATPHANGARCAGPGRRRSHGQRLSSDPRPGLAAAGERILPVIADLAAWRGGGASPRTLENRPP
jgi:glycine cleavage system H lipoate-binding protein